MNFLRRVNIFIIILTVFTICAIASTPKKEDSNSASSSKNDSYLFVYFTGNNKDEEQIRFALSENGYNFKALNQNQPIIKSEEISLTGGVRDPHILRSQNGKTFYMVATDMTSEKGWDSNRGIVLLKSNDLIHWTSKTVQIHQFFPKQFGDIVRVWAPQTIFDPIKKQYMIYFSMLKKGNDEYDKIYYSYVNKDFSALETAPKQLYFCPDNRACIDADIVYHNGKYHLFFKTEGHGNGIKKATSDKLTGDWKLQDKYLQQTTNAVEGSGVFRINNSKDWILMYDMYMNGSYQFTLSSDLENFKIIDQNITMDFNPRHGTILPISNIEAKRLIKKWQSAEEISIVEK